MNQSNDEVDREPSHFQKYLGKNFKIKKSWVLQIWRGFLILLIILPGFDNNWIIKIKVIRFIERQRLVEMVIYIFLNEGYPYIFSCKIITCISNFIQRNGIFIRIINLMRKVCSLKRKGQKVSSDPITSKKWQIILWFLWFLFASFSNYQCASRLYQSVIENVLNKSEFKL